MEGMKRENCQSPKCHTKGKELINHQGVVISVKQQDDGLKGTLRCADTAADQVGPTSM